MSFRYQIAEKAAHDTRSLKPLQELNGGVGQFQVPEKPIQQGGLVYRTGSKSTAQPPPPPLPLFKPPMFPSIQPPAVEVKGGISPLLVSGLATVAPLVAKDVYHGVKSVVKGVSSFFSSLFGGIDGGMQHKVPDNYLRDIYHSVDVSKARTINTTNTNSVEPNQYRFNQNKNESVKKPKEYIRQYPKIEYGNGNIGGMLKSNLITPANAHIIANKINESEAFRQKILLKQDRPHSILKLFHKAVEEGLKDKKKETVM